MEYWDAYLEDGTRTGHLLIRGEPIEEGYFHLVAKVLLTYREEEILFMKRHPEKEPHPGCYEATAGGSVLSGEESEEGAIRELYEETGIRIVELDRMDRRADSSTHSIYDTYLAHWNGEERPEVRLQETETVHYQWVKMEDLYDFMEANEVVPSHRERVLEYLKRRKHTK